MSHSRTAADGARRPSSTASRLARAWRMLPPDRRLAAIAALGLFLTLFLPWYQETVIASGAATKLRSASASLTGWGAFSFVEAAVLLVAVAVLVLLFYRAEGRAFHIPGGDGGVITAAGLWTALLIVWRMFDKEGTTGHGQYATTSGIEWGIFIALGVAALLAYAGSRIRSAHEPEPPLPGELRTDAGDRPPPGGDPARSQPTAATAVAATPRARQGPKPPRPRTQPPKQSWSYQGGDSDQPALSDEPDWHDAATLQRAPERTDHPARTRPSERERPVAPATEAGRETQPPVRPHRARVARDGQPERGLNFSDLDEITFDDPPEAPTVRRTSEDPTEHLQADHDQ